RDNFPPEEAVCHLRERMCRPGYLDELDLPVAPLRIRQDYSAVAADFDLDVPARALVARVPPAVRTAHHFRPYTISSGQELINKVAGILKEERRALSGLPNWAKARQNKAHGDADPATATEAAPVYAVVHT